MSLLRATRILAWILLFLAALTWWLIIGDVETSLAYSNSFTLLSPSATTFAVTLSIIACAVSFIMGATSAILDPARRMISIVQCLLAASLIPSALLLANHIAETTIPAVLNH